MSKSKTKLTPPDKAQCQAMKPGGCRPDAAHFMILGPATMERCTAKPAIIVREKKPAKDGQRGSMSLCNPCFVKFIEQMGPNFATARKI